ncbi:hypothetical protein HYC85_031180 [Camellia sinensis]|uniref:Uncharacterized protein n=1 Tax=Camellia sinensis TaxID=4442 RepID=A0A7J7FQN9_CAMSI|nr:hypothetical protein HYC85_031180 [Camellia sinensis]
MTQEEDLDPKTSNQGAKLQLATAILKEHPSGTLNTLATRNSTFPSGTQLVFNFVLIAVPYIKHVYVIKLKHAQVLELLDCISQHISALNHSQIKDIELFQAIFNAIKHGNVEFVKGILTAYPDIVWIVDKDMHNIFLYAVLQRQEKIFNLLHKMEPKKTL